LCLAAAFLVLPALIALADGNAAPQKLPVQLPTGWFRNAIARFPRTFLIAAAIPLVALAVQVVGLQDGKPAWRVRYDHNLLNLQAEGLESVEIQRRIQQESPGSLLFAVSLADSPAEARALKAKLEALPTVDRVEELGSRLPAHPHAETAPLVQAFRAQLGRLPDKLPESGPVDPFAVGRAMEQFYQFVRNRKEPGAAETARALDRFLDAFERLPLATQAAFVRAYQNRFRQSLLEQLHLLRDVSDPEPLVLADIPPELLSRFVSKEGKWLVQIHPKEEVWDLEPLSRFVADVRRVDPNVTGTPLQNFEASRQIMESYEKAGAYAFAMICAVLLIDFLRRRTLLVVLFTAGAIVGTAALLWQARRAPLDPAWIGLAFVAVAALVAAVADFRNVCDMLLSLLPPVLGMVVTFGTMALLKVDLNPANLIVLPLLLGIGIDNGIHVLHDCRDQSGEYRISGSTVNAILLTSTTTMVGFGSMMISDHRGLFSFGLVLTIGVGSCLFVSLVLLPAALTVLRGRRPTAAGAAAAPLAVGRHAA
jgi:predicted RND superfamily exporter protein